MNKQTTTATTPPQALDIDSRAGFRAALAAALQASVQRRARRILWVDPDFTDWPLDDGELLTTLGEWVRLPQRRLVLLAAGYDSLSRGCPRFVAWRRHWNHAVEAWQVAPERADTLPTLALDDGPICLQLTDKLHWSGVFASDPHEARRWRDWTDAALQHSSPGLRVTTTGL